MPAALEHLNVAGKAVLFRTGWDAHWIALGWLLDVLGLPPESGGAFVTGATMANFAALAAPRHRILKNVGWDVEAKGLFGAPLVTVVVGAEAHPTLLKALGLLGLGREHVVTVPGG